MGLDLFVINVTVTTKFDYLFQAKLKLRIENYIQQIYDLFDYLMICFVYLSNFRQLLQDCQF